MRKTVNEEKRGLELRREGIRALTPETLGQVDGGCWVTIPLTVATTSIPISYALCR